MTTFDLSMKKVNLDFVSSTKTKLPSLTNSSCLTSKKTSIKSLSLQLPTTKLFGEANSEESLIIFKSHFQTVCQPKLNGTSNPI